MPEVFLFVLMARKRYGKACKIGITAFVNNL